jgi:hypothetical protein
MNHYFGLLNERERNDVSYQINFYLNNFYNCENIYTLHLGLLEFVIEHGLIEPDSKKLIIKNFNEIFQQWITRVSMSADMRAFLKAALASAGVKQRAANLTVDYPDVYFKLSEMYEFNVVTSGSPSDSRLKSKELDFKIMAELKLDELLLRSISYEDVFLKRFVFFFFHKF